MSIDFSFNYPNSSYDIPLSIFADISCTIINASPTPQAGLYFTTTPTLPYPLNISTNGTITSGVATSSANISPLKTYTIHAFYVIGPTSYDTSTNLIIGIASSQFIPLTFNYTPYTSYDFSMGSLQILPCTINNSTPPQSAVYIFTSSPIFPAWLTFDYANGNINAIALSPGYYTPLTPYIINANYYINGSFYDASINMTLGVNAYNAADFSFNYYQSSYNLATRTNTDISCNIIHSFPTQETGLVFSINPSLPVSLNMNPIDGRIMGNPSYNQTSPPTTYTIDASYNIGATHYDISSNIIIGIQNYDFSFNYPYSPYNLATRTNVDISCSIIHSIPQENSVNFTISPPLPVTLFMNPNNGEITSTGTLGYGQTSPLTTYTINANYFVNAAPSYDVSSNIIIGIQNYDLSFNYPNSPYDVSLNVPVDISCIIIDSITSASNIIFTTNTPLPMPLSIDASDGTITGTPSSANISPLTTYTINANYDVGIINFDTSSNIILGIASSQFNDISFNYLNSPYGLATGIPADISCIFMDSVPPSNGLIFTISPSLPTSLSFDASDGTIIGTPSFSNISPLTTYTIDASYSINSVHYTSETTIILGINFSPAFFYTGSPYIKQIGIPVQSKSPPIEPVYVIGNLPGIFYTDISPVPLSAIGLTLQSIDAYIVGIPTATTPPITYTIRANNGGVIYDTTLSISIQNAPTISYPQLKYSLTQGVPVSIMPVNPPAGLTYSIDGCALPLGLSFNTSTGEISGTPTMLTTFRQYIITASNFIGPVSTILIINVIKVFLAPQATSDAFSGGACLTDPATAMRRKAEILKYKNNRADLSKSRMFSLIAQGNGPYAKRVWANQGDSVTNPNISGLPQQGNTIICNSPAILCSPTSSSDVPGPITSLCYNPQVPLIGYVQPIRKKVDIGFKWPQKGWSIGDMGFPRGKAGSQQQ